MNHESCNISSNDKGMCRWPCVSWTAVIVGALVGIGVSFLLNLFSVAIGLSTTVVSQEGMVTLAIGGLVGVAICGIVSMYLAGFTAGYLGRGYCGGRNLGILYGFTTWSFALVLTVIFASHIGRYVTAFANTSNPTTVVIVDENAPTANNSMRTNNNGAQKMKDVAEVNAVNAQKATNTLGTGAFIVFGLFFLGALAACCGGHTGMNCKHD